MSTSNTKTGIIHPISQLVDAGHQGLVKKDRNFYMVQLRKEGLPYREIQKRVIEKFDEDISIERIRYITLRYKEALQEDTK